MSKLHEKALDSIFGDMDDFESKKMFGGEPDGDESKSSPSGFDITISIAPKGDSGELPANEGDEMCEGGAVKMADGGVVEAPEPDDMALPPFLRKKKKAI